MLKNDRVVIVSYNSLKIYLISFIILCYVWRIFENNSIINILLFLGLCFGINRNGTLLLSNKTYQSKYFLLFIISILISIILASYNLGSLNKLIALNSVHTHLTFQNIFEGLLIFYLLVLTIDNTKSLKLFLDFLFLFSVFFSVLYLTGFSEGFIKFFGFNIYSEAVYQEIDFNSIERTTFETLDAASFGGILSVFLIYSIHKFSNSKNKIYILISFIFFLSIISTLSRGPVLRLIISIIFYFIFLYGFKTKFLKYLLPIFFLLIIYINFSQTGNLLFKRFSEVIINISFIYTDGFSELQDSFQYRIFRSLLGVPDTFFGLLFGSGGIQTALITLKSGKVSSDHIEYTNWLWQYGLLTFVFLILYFVSLILKHKKLISYEINFYNKSLNSFGISILIGLLTSMLTQPQFIYLWIYLGISVLILKSTYNEKKNLKSRI